MASDYFEKKRSNQEIRDATLMARKFYGATDAYCVDIVECLRSGWIPTVVGTKRLILEIIPDHEMGNIDGLTIVKTDFVRIKIKQSVWKLAENGDGRSRMTLAHELGHGVLNHSKASMGRETGVNEKSKKPEFINAFESAEHMANFFASHFLVEESKLEEFESIKEITVAFKITSRAAEIRYEKIIEKKERASVSLKFSELQNLLANNTNTNSNVSASTQSVKDVNNSNDNVISSEYRSQSKPSSTEALTLTPVSGNRYRQSDSNRVGDYFQDGDSGEIQ